MESIITARNKEIYRILEEKAGSAYWAVLLALQDTIAGSGKTLDEVVKTLVALGAPKGPSRAWIVVRSELNSLKGHNLVGTSQEGNDEKFHLTPAGVKTTAALSEFAETLILPG